MGDFEYLGEGEEPTGIGADLFIRKNKPGPTVGVGYLVEIFENGMKVDERKARDKKHVKEIIKEYKDKYNTKRTFQNENQLHITYKTKEERGEFGENEPVKKEIERQKDIRREEDEEENLKKEVAMENIDQVLLRQASNVEGILYRLLEPTLPIKKWALDETGTGASVDAGEVNLFPETALGGAADNKAEEKAWNDIVTYIAAYFKGKATTPKDDLYNDITRFYTRVDEEIDEWEKMTGKSVGREALSKKIRELLLSRDVNKVKETTKAHIQKYKIADLDPEGISLSPEDANIMREVLLMPAGGANNDEKVQPLVEGVKTSNIKIAEEGMPVMENIVEKLLGTVRTQDEAIAPFKAHELLEEMADPAVLQEISGILPENFSGETVQRVIKEMMAENQIEESDSDEEENKVEPEGSSMMPTKEPGTTINIELRSSEFWEFARSRNKTALVQNIFEEWVNTKKISIDDAKEVWAAVRNKMDELFKNKTAQAHISSDLYKTQLDDAVKLTVMDFEAGDAAGAITAIQEFLKYFWPISFKNLSLNQFPGQQRMTLTMQDGLSIIQQHIMNTIRARASSDVALRPKYDEFKDAINNALAAFNTVPNFKQIVHP